MRVRDYAPADIDAIHAINEAATPGVNSLPAAALGTLADSALVCLVADDADGPVGFVICLGEGVDYGSPNYRWFAERHRSFAYVDRVGVDPAWRSRGVGQALYRELLDRLAGRRAVVGCDVNERPPNPGSLRFHERFGFARVGGQSFTVDKAVVYLEREIG